MAIIKSGASSDTLTIDATSKAARVTLYDTLGNSMGQKPTFRASSAAFAAAASTAPFFIIEGSSTKTIRIQRITCSGHTLTAVAYAAINCNKYSTAISGGTPTTLTQVPLDTGHGGAGTANAVRVYTAAPTAGTLVGAVETQRILLQATTAAAAGIPPVVVFDFRGMGGETSGVVLRGTSQGLGLAFEAAPASAVTMSLSVEWTEE